MSPVRRWLWALVLGLAGPVAALELDMPTGARLVADRPSALDDYALPTGAYADGLVPADVFAGQISRQSWRVDSGTLTTLQMLDPLRAQIVAAGYEVRFECAAARCGGFDFRFATEVIPAPDMHVDIRNFRFLAAKHGNDRAISLMVSRSRTAGYIQVISVAPQGQADPPEATVTPGQAMPPGDLGQALLQRGRIVLRDLDFGSGSDTLAPGPFPQLQALALFLKDNPQIRIALVGHTDSVGALDGNIALSRRRAQAVRARMIETYNLAPAQIEAEGMGYLAPIASNLTAEGRERNRRVEAIILSSN